MSRVDCKSVGRTAVARPRRRAILRSAALAAAALLAACGRQAGHASATQTITVSTLSGNQGIARLLPEFEKKTGIHVNLQLMPYAQLRQRSMAAFVSGGVDSDIYWEDIIWLSEWAKNGYVRPLDDLIQRDLSAADIADILPGAFNAQSKWDGKTWTMPFGANYFLNYYRTDLFAAAGLKPPVTLDDVDLDAARLTKPDARQFGIAMAYQRGSPICSWFLATYAGAGGRLLKAAPRDLTPTLDSPLALAVLKRYVGWTRWAPPGATAYHWDDQTVAMQTGRLAMAPTYSVNGAAFADPRQSAIAGKVGFTYMPRQKASDPPVIPFGGWGIGIAAKSAKVEPSWAFIKWITSAPVQKELARANGAPMRFSVVEDPELQARYPWLKLIDTAEKAGAVYADYRPRYPFYPQLEEELGKELNLAALGQLTPEQAMAAAQKNVSALIAKAGYPVAGAS